MARDKTIKFLRTTRANLDTQKNASGLLAGEPYLITDENRLAIGIANNNYEDFAKKTEVDAKKTDNVSATSRILGRKTSGSGVIEELTLSELMDFIGSATEGDILYRGASSWARLARGTNGQVLTLASGLPSWANASGGKEILTAYRTSNFTLSSTSLIDITNMSVTLKAGKTYHIVCEVGMQGGGSNACELDLILSNNLTVATMSASWSSDQINNLVEDSFVTTLNTTTIAGIIYNNGSSTLSLGLIKGIIIVGGSDTTLTLQGKKTSGTSITIRNCVLVAREV